MDTNSNQPGRPLVFALLLIAGAGISVLSYNGLTSISGPAGVPLAGLTDPFPADWIRPVLMFLIMLAGMFFNQLFENLKAQKEAGRTTTNIPELLITGWKGISFWMAIVVSPIIFYGTYYLVDSLPDGSVAFFYAFQNGFFWYNIFNTFDLKTKARK